MFVWAMSSGSDTGAIKSVLPFYDGREGKGGSVRTEKTTQVFSSIHITHTFPFPYSTFV